MSYCYWVERSVIRENDFTLVTVLFKMSFGAGAFKVEAVVVPIRKYYICKYYDKDTRYQKQKRLVRWLGPAFLFFRILIWIFDFGSEKLPGLTRNDPTGPFSWKSRKRFGPVKLFRLRRVCIQDQGSNNCENDIRINLSVNEAKLTGLWARGCAAIQPVLTIEFAFGPEKFPGLSKNEPQELKTKHPLEAPSQPFEHQPTSNVTVKKFDGMPT